MFNWILALSERTVFYFQGFIGTEHLRVSVMEAVLSSPRRAFAIQQRHGPDTRYWQGVTQTIGFITRRIVSMEGPFIASSQNRGAFISNARVCRGFEPTELSSCCWRTRRLQRLHDATDLEHHSRSLAVEKRIVEVAVQSSRLGEMNNFYGSMPRVSQKAARRKGVSVGCTVYEHSPANNNEDSVMEEAGGVGDASTTEAIPPTTPSIASWVLRLWKARFIPILCFNFFPSIKHLVCFFPPLVLIWFLRTHLKDVRLCGWGCRHAR